MVTWRTYRGIVESARESEATISIYDSRNNPKFTVNMPKQAFINRSIDYREGAVVELKLKETKEGALAELIKEIPRGIVSEEEITKANAELEKIFGVAHG